MFKRSPKLAAVLQALANLSERNGEDEFLAPDVLGGYYTDLSSWLYEQEAPIVDFVRRPTGQSTKTLTLASLLLIDCLLLLCLQGELENKVYSTEELLLLIVKHSTKAESTDWQGYTNEAQKIHTRAWVDVMKGVDSRKNNVRTCRRNLLSVLNKAQGDSQGVRFIDAALALDILLDFEQSEWALPQIEAIGASASPAWLAACEVYNTLFKAFSQALTADRQAIEDSLQKLSDFIGSSEPKEVFQAIETWINHMKQSQKAYKLESKPSLNATRLSKIKTTFAALIKEQSQRRLALRLSDVGPTIKDAQEHLQYFEDFQNEATQQISQTEHRIAQLRAEIGDASLPTDVEKVYRDVESLLTQTIDTAKEVSR